MIYSIEAVGYSTNSVDTAGLRNLSTFKLSETAQFLRT